MQVVKGLRMNQARKIAAKVTVFYLVIGGFWIFFTDYFSMLLSKSNLQLYAIFQQYKGWLYIFITGVILYTVIFSLTSRLLSSRNEFRVKDEQYRSLFNHNPDAVAELDLKGNLVALNPIGVSILGVEPSDIYGKPALFMLQDEKENAKKSFYRTLSGESSMVETTIINHKAENRLLRCKLLPSVINGETKGVYVIARDITELRRDEELMIMSEKLSVIGHLAAAVAHEIRNPLTSLKGFIQLLIVSREINDVHLDIMLKEIERINIISSEMLALGTKQAVNFSNQDIRTSIIDVLTLMKAQANFNEIKLVYRENVTDEVPVLIDNIQMKQVLINLIKNSLEAINESGTIIIHLNKSERDAIIIVSDDGTGMEPERLERIGEPFYSTKEKGTGIGLAVCQKIIHRHHGQISFQSKKNEGTTVTIRIPLADSSEQ